MPLNTITASSSMFQVAQPLLVPTRAAQGLNGINLSSIPAATSVLLAWDLPAIPYQIGNAPNNAPRGFQLTDVTITFALSSANGGASQGASTMSFTAWTYNASDGSPTTTGPIAYGGSSSQWTYNEGSSVGASFGAFSPSSNLAQIVCVPGAGLNTVLNVDNQRLSFEWYMLPGATTSTMTLSVLDVTAHGNLILGG